jgi:hypothetical protein
VRFVVVVVVVVGVGEILNCCFMDGCLVDGLELL